MRKAQSQPDYPKGATFETVRAVLQDIAKQQEKTSKEFDRQMKGFDRQIKEYNKRFGDFTNRFGEVVEYMVAPNLLKKFRKLGFTFNESTRCKYIEDDERNISFEIDYFLENGSKAMLVEVKTNLTVEDVKDHQKRLEKMRIYADMEGDKRTFMGAVAGVVMTSAAKKYALSQGLFVIEPSGETFNITSPDNNPKEW